MVVFFEEPEIVSAELDEAGNVIVHWQNLAAGEVVRACCEAQLEKVCQGARVIVFDASEARWMPPSETLDWIADTLFPDLRDAGLVAIITVIPRSAVTRTASTRWHRAGEPFSFGMYEVETLETAIELARALTRSGAEEAGARAPPRSFLQVMGTPREGLLARRSSLEVSREEKD